MKTVAVIPARYDSTRFPGKPLVHETGKYLVQHVYEQVLRAETVEDVVVATDDQRILDAVESFGGRAVMTRDDHRSGTDRVAEVAANLDADIILNVQGDEPEIEPGSIARLIAVMVEKPEAPAGTLACRFDAAGDPADPNAVKVVVDRRGFALYFSRSLIPYPRPDQGKVTRPDSWLLHLGIYAYRRDFLLRLTELTPTPLEESEKLEQLRILEHGHAIAVAVVERSAIGIDTPDDYKAFVARYRGN